MPPSSPTKPPLTPTQQRLLKLMEQAVPLVPPARIAEISHRLVTGADPIADTDQTKAIFETFRVDLALFTAPPGRSTAVERLAKHLRLPPAGDDGRALAGLARAGFVLFQVTGAAKGGAVPARDLLSGRELLVEDGHLASRPALAGLRFASRLAPVGDRGVAIGFTMPLGDAILELLRPWQSRDGRSWANPARAAETLYRYILRHGDEEISGDLEDETGPVPFPHRPQDGPVHALAHAWSRLPEGAAPPPDQERQARHLAITGEPLLEALSGATQARSRHLFDLAAAYERVLAQMLDTLQRRAAIGQHASLQVLEWLEQALTLPGVPPEARALFQRLKSKAGPAEGADLDRLRGRIRALRAKTVDQGCTEEEALAAAEKVADLLDRYGLSLSELELRHQPCDGFGIDTGRKRRAPIDDIVPEIADFCDCRCWLELTPDQSLRHVFFGLPADTAGARYLYDVVAATLDAQTRAFRTGELYQDHPSSHRASAGRSFQIGLIDGIGHKLRALKRQRTAGIKSAGGRDLVPIKHDVIAEELDKLGIAFTTKARRGPRVLSKAYDAGREAGDEFEFHPGLGGQDRR